MENGTELKLTRRKVRKLERESIHRARNWSKADVSIAEWPKGSGYRVVVKDMSRLPLWFRTVAGRYLLWREWRALSALKGIKGIPQPVARPNADCIVMEFLEGQPIDSLSPWKISEDAVRRTAKVLGEVHARGVTHGDLHGYNILVTPDGEVGLIDWATACVFGKRRFGLKWFSFQEWRALDDRALAKVKITCTPYDVTEKDYDLLVNGSSPIYRFVTRLRDRLGIRGSEASGVQRTREQKYEKLRRRLDEYSTLEPEEARAKMRDEIIGHRNRKLEVRAAKQAARQNHLEPNSG